MTSSGYRMLTLSTVAHWTYHLLVQKCDRFKTYIRISIVFGVNPSQVSGKPGLITLVIAVSVGLFIQNWDRGVDVLTMGLEMVGLAPPTSSEAPSPARGKR